MRSGGEIPASPCMYVHACIYIFAVIHESAISSRGDYSRAASISFRACSGAATIRERRLFESGIYSVIYYMSKLQIHFCCVNM